MPFPPHRDCTARPCHQLGRPSTHPSSKRPPGAQAREERFVALVHEHRLPVLAHALRLTGGDRARAEDVVQETFLRAWRHVDRMTPERGSVRGWLARVAHNVVVDGYRSSPAAPLEATYLEALLETQPRVVVDVVDDALSRLVLGDALASLGERHRVVLDLIYLQDRTAVETAHMLDLPVGTVKSRTFYALRRLRDTLTSSDPVSPS